MISEKRRTYNKNYYAKWYLKNRSKKLKQNKLWYSSERGQAFLLKKKLEYKRKLLPIQVRFWKYVDKKGENECWEWNRSKYPNGYGRIGKHYAHRFSWILTNGEIPNGLHVCHSCDNPPCVNPKHLWLGTVADNMHDRDSKGRGRYGFSKLIMV